MKATSIPPSVVADMGRALDRARSLDRITRVVASSLARHRPVDRVSIRVHVPDEHAVVIVAVWSSFRTEVHAGLRMAEGATSLADVVRTGGPVVVEEPTDAHLLDTVLRQEGLRSWVTAPLRDGGVIRALLSVSSRSVRAFRATDVPAFAAIARVVERRVFELLPDAEG